VSPPVGHKFTPRTTPLHVYQLVMQLLRLTFKEISEDPDYPFIYTDSSETTGVYITSILDKTSQMFGAKPIILVTRGGMSTQPISMGDLAQANMMAPQKTKTTFVTSAIDVKVLSRKPNECDILANEVFSFFTACRTVLPYLTKIHKIENISASPVTPYEDDDHVHYVQVQMAYTMQYKWDWSITPTLLGQIGLYINDDLVIDLQEPAE